MEGHTVPAGGGRGVLVRAGDAGECVQLAILSTRGNIIAAVTLDRAQLPGLLEALHDAQGEADHDLMAVLTRRQGEAERRHREALARNPWLNGHNDGLRDEAYIRRGVARGT
jgi:hypothetical protein